MGDFTPYEKVKALCISGLQNHPSQTLGAGVHPWPSLAPQRDGGGRDEA